MKKMLLLLIVLLVAAMSNVLAAQPVKETDNGGLYYEGQYRFIFFLGDGKQIETSEGSVYFNPENNPGYIHLSIWCEPDNKLLQKADQGQLDIRGLSNYEESGKLCNFWTLSHFNTGTSTGAASDFPDENQITALGWFRTRNLDKRIQMRGTGAMRVYESLIYFEFTFSGRMPQGEKN